MRVHYDTEFHERGPDHPVELISIGLVSDGGRELYLINGEIDLEALAGHPWLMENVVPSLPLVWVGDQETGSLEWMHGDDYHFHVFNRRAIREKLTEFFDSIPAPELWGYCSAYDHVLLAQCFGIMTQMHHKLSYYTNDISQLALTYGLSHRKLPAQINTAHNALHDARWTRDAHEFLEIEISKLDAIHWTPAAERGSRRWHAESGHANTYVECGSIACRKAYGAELVAKAKSV